MGTIIWIVGIVCTVLAIVDVFKKNITTIGKIIMTVLLLLTSWIGLALYYFWAKNHVTEWFK
ncbi:PLDc N-terminal domain-containing protein [Parabacteroides massiliensis]|jgi:uncharacterized BrkB/YihY/UPF0761 family membrane protein|uniref:PLDc N-terminal domain-containing protein n=1 Tax=Parabacteroides massiliensis TaxID=1750560 RepID=UPI0009D781FF|nr:PLDc N-terminal domain-containing protein [Parabacteroides massiliensis]